MKITLERERDFAGFNKSNGMLAAPDETADPQLFIGDMVMRDLSSERTAVLLKVLTLINRASPEFLEAFNNIDLENMNELDEFLMKYVVANAEYKKRGYRILENTVVNGISDMSTGTLRTRQASGLTLRFLYDSKRVTVMNENDEVIGNFKHEFSDIFGANDIHSVAKHFFLLASTYGNVDPEQLV